MMGRCTNARMNCRQSCGALVVACRSPRHVTETCRTYAAKCKGSRRAMQLCCTKTYLVVLNFMFLVGGGTAVGVGFWMRFDREPLLYVDLFHAMQSSGPLVLVDRVPAVFVLVGGFVALLSFLGCCGACADSACFLCIYALLLCLILITEIVIVVIAIVFRQQILKQLEFSLQHQIKHEYNKTGRPSNLSALLDEQDHVAAVVDAMQIKFNCCGATGPGDYRFSAWFNSTRHLEVFVPISCCITATSSSSLSAALHSSPSPHISSYGSGGGSRLHLPTSPMTSSAKMTSAIDDNQCQLHAVLFQTQKDSPTSAISVIAPTAALKTQGCQRSFNEWYVSNTASFVVAACAVIILQILDLIAACVLMARVRRKHANCQWSEESEFG